MMRKAAASAIVMLTLVGCSSEPEAPSPAGKASSAVAAADPFPLLGAWFAKDYPTTPEHRQMCREQHDKSCLRLADEMDRGRAALLALGRPEAMRRTLALVGASCDPSTWPEDTVLGPLERCRSARVALSILDDAASVAEARRYFADHPKLRAGLAKAYGPELPPGLL